MAMWNSVRFGIFSFRVDRYRKPRWSPLDSGAMIVPGQWPFAPGGIYGHSAAFSGGNKDMLSSEVPRRCSPSPVNREVSR